MNFVLNLILKFLNEDTITMLLAKAQKWLLERAIACNRWTEVKSIATKLHAYSGTIIAVCEDDDVTDTEAEAIAKAIGENAPVADIVEMMKKVAK